MHKDGDTSPAHRVADAALEVEVLGAQLVRERHKVRARPQALRALAKPMNELASETVVNNINTTSRCELVDKANARLPSAVGKYHVSVAPIDFEEIAENQFDIERFSAR